MAAQTDTRSVLEEGVRVRESAVVCMRPPPPPGPPSVGGGVLIREQRKTALLTPRGQGAIKVLKVR